MPSLKIQEILDATGGRVLFRGNNNDVFQGVSIDSRTIKEGELFIALKGQRFDGHDFLMDAMKKGTGAMVSIPPPVPIKGKTIIYVNNTLKGLHSMASYRRKKVNIPVIAVTGTNGKTTTKELIASALGVSFKVLKSSGNLNNQIGLPLNLINITDEHEFAVLEMGASLKGDIKDLCDIAQPDYGVLTNIGQAHLDGFGSLNIIRDTKLELLDAVGVLIANADDRFLMDGIAKKLSSPPISMAGKRLITYGIDSATDIRACNITFGEWGSSFDIYVRHNRFIDLNLKVPGRCNIYNALAAVSVCHALGVPAEDIKKGIESFEGVPMRFELKRLKGVTVLSDLYNANPSSMEQAIRELVRLKKSKAIAILGDMLELGSYAVEAHEKVADLIKRLPIDIFVAVGPMMSRVAKELSREKETYMFKDSEEAMGILSKICRSGDTVLIKGSRGMKMERILEGGENAL